jgi:uncharacterized protein YcnI
VAVAGLAAAGAASPAAAHVDVLPRTVTQGEAVELTARVPNERPAATVEVRIAFPPQVTVFSIGAPPAGWRTLTLRAPDGRLRGVRYVGGRIRAGRYADFTFLATPFESGTAVFRTEQAHADRTVSRWTGPPETAGDPAPGEPEAGGPGPAPAIEVVAEGAGQGATEGAAEGAAVGGDADEDASSGAGVWLGVIAIAIAAGAALFTGFLWSTRPARLPEDDPEDAA